MADFLATEKPFVGGDSGEELHKHGVHHAHGMSTRFGCIARDLCAHFPLLGFKAGTLQAHFEEAGLVNVKTDTSFSISKHKLKELGGDETPLKRFLADAETNPK